MFGLNGNDVMDGGPGRDIILGGPDGGAAPGGTPNSDIMSGGPGDDVNLWAPGDGSETFIGGPVRLTRVEQVFCTDQAGGSIAFANLTDPTPSFVAVSHPEVEILNSLVAAMIR